MAWIETVTGIGSNIAILIIVVLFLAVAVVGILYITQNWKKYKQFQIEIWQKDGFGQFTVKYDDGGIFIDGRTQNKRLFLKKNNVGLNPDNIPYLTTQDGRKKVYLLQTGLKNFSYIKPKIKDELIHFTVGEEDVNWAVNAYERQKKLFAQSWIAQYLPFIMLAFVCMIILILFVQLFNKFPLILEMIKEMKEVARALAQAKSGTVIIP